MSLLWKSTDKGIASLTLMKFLRCTGCCGEVMNKGIPKQPWAVGGFVDKRSVTLLSTEQNSECYKKEMSSKTSKMSFLQLHRKKVVVYILHVQWHYAYIHTNVMSQYVNRNLCTFICWLPYNNWPSWWAHYKSTAYCKSWVVNMVYFTRWCYTFTFISQREKCRGHCSADNLNETFVFVKKCLVADTQTSTWNQMIRYTEQSERFILASDI